METDFRVLTEYRSNPVMHCQYSFSERYKRSPGIDRVRMNRRKLEGRANIGNIFLYFRVSECLVS